MIPLLSVIVPGIRPQNWQKLYDSVASSLESNDFEVIFVGPNGWPAESDMPNAFFIQDWGSPARAMNIGLVASHGQFVTWAADDGVFLPGMLETVVNLVDKSNEKHIITGKYVEGAGHGMLEDDYYRLHKSINCNGLHVDPNAWILNVSIINTEYLKLLGGWDSSLFEVAVMAYFDLAVRVQKDGAQVELYPDPIYQCGHMPDITGDHAPIHYAQILHDTPLFSKVWSDPQAVDRIYIPLDNWTEAEEKWGRRFNKI